tara:strand:- start:1375 stop:1644 length:270 start_codon:yes stop_codon:yes gene_type:complete
MAAAPAGYRTFSAGEVLTAANVQTFLQDQVIAVFASSTARDAAITSPAEGQHCFLKDTDALQYYTGSAWVAAGGAGGGGFETNFLLMGA